MQPGAGVFSQAGTSSHHRAPSPFPADLAGRGRWQLRPRRHASPEPTKAARRTYVVVSPPPLPHAATGSPCQLGHASSLCRPSPTPLQPPGSPAGHAAPGPGAQPGARMLTACLRDTRGPQASRARDYTGISQSHAGRWPLFHPGQKKGGQMEDLVALLFRGKPSWGVLPYFVGPRVQPSPSVQEGLASPGGQ